MGQLDFAIPTGTNTLDDEPFDDGHALNSWVSREVIHNDRAQHAFMSSSLVNKGWDLVDTPLVFKGFYWVRVIAYVGPIAPGRRTCTVRFRGKITNGLPAHFAVDTLAGPFAHDQANHAGWTTETGTGAVANWEITGVPILEGRHEQIDLMMTGGIVVSTDNDVTDVVTNLNRSSVSSAAAFGAIAVGWVIRLEDAASGDPLTQFRMVINVVSTSQLSIRPGWDEWEDIAVTEYESGEVNFRAREAAQIDLYNVAIDEDDLTGELGE